MTVTVMTSSITWFMIMTVTLMVTQRVPVILKLARIEVAVVSVEVAAVLEGSKSSSDSNIDNRAMGE